MFIIRSKSPAVSKVVYLAFSVLCLLLPPTYGMAQNADCIPLRGDAIFLKSGTQIFKDSYQNSKVLFTYQRDSVRNYLQIKNDTEDAIILDTSQIDERILVNTLVADSVWIHSNSITHTPIGYYFVPRLTCDKLETLVEIFQQERDWLKKGYCKADPLKLLVNLNQLVECKCKTDNHAECISLVDQLIGFQKDFPKIAAEYNSSNYVIYRYRAFSKMRIKDHEGAMADFNAYLKEYNKDSEAYMGRGLCHGGLGNLEKGILDLTRAIELDSKNSAAFFFRGIFYKDLGKIEMACIDLNKAKELGTREAQKIIQSNCD